jgi:hypothetical protein
MADALGLPAEDYESDRVSIKDLFAAGGYPCFAGSSLGDVARQISEHAQGRAGRAQ